MLHVLAPLSPDQQEAMRSYAQGWKEGIYVRS